jgi:hypothetical protein
MRAHSDAKLVRELRVSASLNAARQGRTINPPRTRALERLSGTLVAGADRGFRVPILRHLVHLQLKGSQRDLAWGILAEDGKQVPRFQSASLPEACDRRGER